MSGGTDPIERLSTREAFRDELVALMQRHPDVYCLDSDTGLFGRVDFAAAGDRYLDLGIAEQTLFGVAAGLAASGKQPFATTMAAFAASRALEAVKIDIAYNNLPVRIAATHGGLAAGHLGPTHHALEDVAVMRTLPNMAVVVPADAASCRALTADMLHQPGPVYLRLGRQPTPVLPEPAEPLRIGRAVVRAAGEGITIVAAGPYPVIAALRARSMLGVLGLQPEVLEMHTVKPLDEAALERAAGHSVAFVTVEEHWSSGGLGSAVAEWATTHRPVRVSRVAMQDTFVQFPGGQEELLDHHGINEVNIVASALESMADEVAPAVAPPAWRPPPPVPRNR